MADATLPQDAQPVTPRYGCLVILDPRYRSGKHRLALCRCDCGSVVAKRYDHVISGRTKTCGKGHVGSVRTGVERHAPARRSEYRIWGKMKERCYSPTHQAYSSYGGRGITMCDRWKHSFAAFLEDVGPRPSPRHSIDRINNDGNYEPHNCRWATMAEQNSNKSNTVFVTHNGVTYVATDLARLYGIPPSRFLNRLSLGWKVEVALTHPPTPRRRPSSA